MVPKMRAGLFPDLQHSKVWTESNQNKDSKYSLTLCRKRNICAHDANDPFYKSSQYKTAFGADLKIGIGTNLNIDATLNPDFGQVEVDPCGD